jgi:hypothetical protein
MFITHARPDGLAYSFAADISYEVDINTLYATCGTGVTIEVIAIEGPAGGNPYVRFHASDVDTLTRFRDIYFGPQAGESHPIEENKA